jgi:hypothetical protein
MPTVGVLVRDAPGWEQFWKIFPKALNDLGYVERKNIRFEFRSDQGQQGRLPELAAELVRLKADVIVAWFTQAAIAAKQATREIPIVCALCGDLVGNGLVERLAQNELCSIQALTAELPSGSLLFGTQYHPEFTLAVAAGLIEMRAASLVAEGFGRDCAELVAMARDFRALHAEPERRDLAWRYGIGSEILDPVRRTAEIGNWLRETGKISSS